MNAEDPGTTSPVLEVRNLTVELPTPKGTLHAVRGVSLDVSRGETVCVVGESGCGKSMTSLAIMGLLPRGAVRKAERLSFAGKDLDALPEREMENLRGNRLSMIFQEPMTSLNPVFTIGEQLAEPMLRHCRTTRVEANDKAEQLLETVGISGARRRLKQYPHQLSGGLRQRIMIAIALMCDPSLIIADEPTTALDVTIQAQILHLLKRLQREFGMGLLFITHDLGLVSRIADRVVIMYAGQVVESGSVLDVFESPLHPYTQGLLDCLPVPGRVCRGAHLGSIPGMVPNLVGHLEGCGFSSRCSAATARCTSGMIGFRQGRGRQTYRCVLDPQHSRAAWDRHISPASAGC